MSEQFHKDIHKDCFKLRCLLTNYCDNNCSYCLNDFQPKTKEKLNINHIQLANLIHEYIKFCKSKRIKSEVYFSGGEPNLHPYFVYLINETRRYKPDKFVLCTNGNKLIRTDNNKGLVYLDFTELHISIHSSTMYLNTLERIIEKLDDLIYIAKSKHIKIQLKELVIDAVFNPNLDSFLFSADTDTNGLSGEFFCNLYEYYTHKLQDRIEKAGIQVNFKVWADYYKRNDEEYMAQYTNFIKRQPWILNRGKNFIPHNRGKLCEGCTKDCVTLKALWTFPDNTCSPCPQGVYDPIPLNNKRIAGFIAGAYQMHQSTATGER